MSAIPLAEKVPEFQKSRTSVIHDTTVACPVETDVVSQSEDSMEADDPLPLNRYAHPVSDSFHVSAAF